MTAVKNHDWVQMSAARTRISPHSVQSFLTQAALDLLSELGARGELHLIRRSFAGVDSTQIRPPSISTICLAMARPRPVPPSAVVLELSTWWNWSKIRSCYQGVC